MKPILFNTEQVDQSFALNHVYEELYEKIALLSDKDFADIVVKIVGAEYNIYDRFVMYTRMKNAIDLLAYGMCKEDVDKLLQTQTDDIAIKLIRGGF